VSAGAHPAVLRRRTPGGTDGTDGEACLTAGTAPQAGRAGLRGAGVRMPQRARTHPRASPASGP